MATQKQRDVMVQAINDRFDQLGGNTPEFFWQQVHDETLKAVKAQQNFYHQQLAQALLGMSGAFYDAFEGLQEEVTIFRSLEHHLVKETLTPEALATTLHELKELRLRRLPQVQEPEPTA